MEDSVKYVIGIDQGASKTHAIVSDEYGIVLGMGKSYGACHSSDGMTHAITAVKEAVDQALEQSGISIQEIELIAAGMTGVDWDFEGALLTKALREAFPTEKVIVVNDCIIAMRAGTRRSYGCVLCAGSGLNCAVRNENGDQIIYGFYIDDEFQGGYSLGKKTIRAVIDSHIGLKGETKLTRMILDYFNVDTVDELLYRKMTNAVTSKDYLHLPIILEEAAAQNDTVALKVLADYGKNIAMYAVRGMEKLSMLNMGVDIILSGSIFKCKLPILREAVSLEVHKYAINAKIVDAVYEPIVGAALLGLDSLNKVIPEEVYDNLEKSADKFKIKRMIDEEEG
jgi:N-acetylglucosamine kinase-like BadF-type ATPase